MAGPTQPDPGEMNINASAVDVRYVDDSDLPKLSKIRGQHEQAMSSLMVLTASQIDRAGLNPDDVERARVRITEYREVQMFLAASRQMTENLQQTGFVLGHDIAVIIGEITAQARRRAKTSPDRGEILNVMTPLIDYHTAPAKKARASRLKAQREQANGDKPSTPAPPGNGTAPKPPGALAGKRAAHAVAASPEAPTAPVREEEGPASAAG